MTRWRRPALLLLLVPLVAACSHTGASGGDSGGDSGGATSSSAAVGTAAQAPKASERSAATTTDAVQPLSRAVISTGQVTVHARHVSDARADVVRLVASWGGAVSDEQTESDRRGRMTRSTMTLRVPTARFDAAMDALARIGRVEQQSRESKDVTTQVIDNRARVRAAQRSIESVERLLGRATRLSDVIAIESDLARRQADLDSLEHQEAWLADQTSLSTITVELSRTMPAPPPPVHAHGFLAGLGAGWSALRHATVGALTLVGAVLPFAVVLLLVGWPAWLVLRRRRPVATAAADS